MTGHFGTLIYTDCRPRQGLWGSAGLQFQARSSDAVAAAETMVKDHLLYEPPSRWMADRRPVEQYPPSFAHLSAAGHLATAVGRYLGKEANGTREGNQLTHAIVTTDAGSYGGLRPAQLYGATFWSAVPAATTQSAPVVLAGGAAAYSPARARDFVLAQTNGPSMLLALVSALAEAGRPGRPRVLFVGEDVPTIVEWLVAGTLLVSRGRALELGFKIFSTDPARSALPIVAVHSEFAGPSARIDNQLGYAVFDLREHVHTEVPPTVPACRWVDLFLAGDPRDVVDALDVAAESGLGDEEAAALGLAAIMHHEPDPRHAEAIVGWLRTGPQPLRAAYGADLADLFAELPERWSRHVLVLLDAVGCDGLLPGKAAEVRIALIIKEAEAAATAGTVTDEQLPELPDGEWESDRDEQVRQIFIEAVSAPGVDPLALDALLRVASRFRVDLRPADFGAACGPFIRYWADHPGKFVPRSWPSAAEMVNLLIAELTARAEAGGTQGEIVGDGWRTWLLPRMDRLEPPLAEAVLGATVRHGDDRASFVERRLESARHDPDRFEWTAGALWSQSPPTVAELRLMSDMAPAGLKPPPRIFRSLLNRVTGSAPLTPDVLKLCRDLVQRGQLDNDRRLQSVLADDERLTETVARLDSAATPPDQIEDLLQDLGRSSARLIEMRAAAVTAALLRVVAPRAMEALFNRHPTLLDRYLERLGQALRSRSAEGHAISAFYFANAVLGNDKARRQPLMKALDQWLVRVSEGRIRAAERRFEGYGKRWGEMWRDHVEALSGQRRRYRIAHPFGGR